MKKLTTFEISELDSHIYHIYFDICKSAENVALLECKNKSSDGYIFGSTIENLNDAIIKLRDLTTIPEELTRLDKEKLLNEATRFLNADFY